MDLNLLKRSLVAVFGVPLVILLIWLGSWPLLAFLMLQAGLAGREFFDLARHREVQPHAVPGVVLAALFPAIFYAFGRTGLTAWLLLAAALPVLTAGGAEIFGRRGVQGGITRLAVTVFGIYYAGALVAFQLLLRHYPGVAESEGFGWLLLAYLGTWAVDVGSYFAGSLLGRHKLDPLRSPGKTWEGAIGGALCAALATWAAGTLWLGLIGLPAALILGALFSVAGPVGDLVESVLKRDAGVKDSSQLIPGHGGVLDRFDSLLFNAPLAFFFRFLIS